MKNEMSLEGYGVVEVNASKVREIDGGYGYHPSQGPGSITVGNAIGKYAGIFWDGLTDGFSNMYSGTINTWK
ncbi:MAG: hypothetical protein CFE22_15005 [Cytophagaceae bacterium BCCC1]|nr:MAG: hypothetical protein CFE22_15005 [Cytophagaceae bacterium BCCC1]